ncbi:putative eka-like protein [Erysiphe neolycopersici]|uniref:Putative eka-like protein n=1 Tax=Erysiphe neolycopersici TaxID=212602 RepID=A0A420H6T8_9PEZI|nr:putative eka-like protein [Erysiphe neolycopersici]
MPPVCAKRQYTMLDIAKDRARSRLKKKGLSQNFISLDSMEKALREKDDDIPYIEMIDEHVDKLITQGLKDSQWATETPRKSTTKAQIFGGVEKSTNDTNSAQVAVTHVREINQQNTEHSNQAGKTPIGAKNTEIILEKEIEMHDLYRRNNVPPELHTIIQPEERRAAMMAAKFKTCTIAINAIDSNKEFAQVLLTYLRAAIAQYMANGSGSTPPVLPSRPTSSALTKPLQKPQQKN